MLRTLAFLAAGCAFGALLIQIQYGTSIAENDSFGHIFRWWRNLAVALAVILGVVVAVVGAVTALI